MCLIECIFKPLVPALDCEKAMVPRLPLSCSRWSPDVSCLDCQPIFAVLSNWAVQLPNYLLSLPCLCPLSPSTHPTVQLTRSMMTSTPSEGTWRSWLPREISLCTLSEWKMSPGPSAQSMGLPSRMDRSREPTRCPLIPWPTTRLPTLRPGTPVTSLSGGRLMATRASLA